MGLAALERKPEVYAYHNPLSTQIEYFKFNWKKEKLPDNWFDLPGTGFQINKQVDMLFKNQVFSREEFLTWFKQTERDIRGFAIEYLCEGLVFPISYEIKGTKIIDPVYGKEIEDFVSEEERKGVVKKTVKEKIKPFLINAPDGSIAVMTSPSGWSDLKEEDGTPIIYPDSQTYILQKRGEKVVGFTIRTDFQNEEHREFLRRLPPYGKTLKETASVSDYVEAVALCNSKIDNLDIKNIIDIMRDARFDLSKGSLFAYKNRMWGEVYKDLERGDKLWDFDKYIEEMIKDFKMYTAMKETFNRQQLKEVLAATILRIAKFLRGDKKKYLLDNGNLEKDDNTGSWYRPLYGEVFLDVQSLPGCAGGGSNKTSLIDSLTPRLGETVEGVMNCVTCPFCGETVNAILTKNKIICPNTNCQKSVDRK